MNNTKSFGLIGKLLVTSDIKVISGLRVGGSSGGLKIGGVDQNVIIDPEGRPYIPGSSIKGKLRSLLEWKLANGDQNYFNSKTGQRTVKNYEEYSRCISSQIFGSMLMGKKISDDKKGMPTLTRLYVRDVFLDKHSITEKMASNIDLPYTEVKYETAINRIRGSAASGSLRQIERVPAGAIFNNLEMVFNLFLSEDKKLIKHLLSALKLLEDDYLGGMGSRGYGKIKFENVRMQWNSAKAYETGNLPGPKVNEEWETLNSIIKNIDAIVAKLV